MGKLPKVSVDILIIKGNKILLDLLSDKWKHKGRKVYGVPGRDIRFGEKISDTVKRDIKEEFGCNVKKSRVICVNENFALGSHYIGIGVVCNIDGEPKLLMKKDWERWEWFKKDSIPSNLFPPAKHLIECYFKNKFYNG